ncbi:hypothetical protein BH24PSE2_BH24PSE2_19520 [soil metagenome]
MHPTRLPIFVFLMLLTGAPAFSQAPENADRADAAYQAEDWEAAAEAYSAIAAEVPDNGRAWYRLGVARRYLEEYEAAEQAFQRASEAGVPQPFVNFEMAKLHAQQGDDDAALKALESAAKAGFSNLQALETSPQLERFSDGERFAALLEHVKRNAMPCEYETSYREFDFWIGRWDVADASGATQGQNVISKEENGCVLIEKWKGAGGSTGMSMNFYDPGKGKWVQQWVSANGGFIYMEGGIEDGSMVLVGTINWPGQAEPDLPFRGTWTLLDDGRVRQFFEQSNDGGDTWIPWFEGFYSRANADSG